ncbi:NitT/TauT family transport system ATP-binding protein [Clostridium algifaecis]|uniref:NitT/TauT family transport system ATP-binding protein n=1 Tax=Clostridium algifaecis TaxID=1472040 RepID=A0ABS4KN16_9CLOT|nr:ABC transporter ATP-binding protein [Clostridium algifaecis]MBP2031425.1 NitT/TauT family transport system ATP-binding protein [Clostridium algifaecis]
MEEIIIKDLYKYYGDNKVFYNLNLKFTKGKITMVLGPSGCGKTTLLNIIAGIDKNYSGQVRVNRKNISYVFQEDRLIPNLSVFENVAFVIKSGEKRKDIDSIVNKYLEMVQLEEYGDKFPDELSGGMKRRVALARALAYNGDLILMDEPFKGLDFELKNKIMDKFLQIQMEKKRTVIIVTHDKEEAQKLGDMIYSLD